MIVVFLHLLSRFCYGTPDSVSQSLSKHFKQPDLNVTPSEKFAARIAVSLCLSPPNIIGEFIGYTSLYSTRCHHLHAFVTIRSLLYYCPDFIYKDPPIFYFLHQFVYPVPLIFFVGNIKVPTKFVPLFDFTIYSLVLFRIRPSTVFPYLYF